jgi:cytochrome c553
VLVTRLGRLFLLLALFIAGAAAAADVPSPCDLGPVMPPSKDETKFEKALYAFLEAGCYDKPLNWARDKDLRNTGPVISVPLGNANNFGTHPAIRIFYSPQAIEWMKKPKATRGEVPDGTIIVKEQHGPPASQNNGVSSWTTMVRDGKGAWDGWYWSYHGNPCSGNKVTLPCPPQPPPQPPTPAQIKGDISFPDSGFGNYCVNCHASADNTSVTYIDERNIVGTPMTYLEITPSLLDPTATPAPPEASVDLHALHANAGDAKPAVVPPPLDPGILQQLAPGRTVGDYPSFPGETWDHVVSRGRPHGPEQFLTSDQCIGCHDATQNSSAPPNMIYPPSSGDQFAAQFLPAYAPTSKLYNLSPYGEWRASMMGLSGRDPVFYAQLASERTVHNQKNLPVEIQNLCFRCHGVMGQRQLHIDQGDTKPFLADYVQQYGKMPLAKYGALARDGVSCTVCHHIAAEGLGKPETFTGEFKVGPANEINGPYPDPITLPMDQALGMKPVEAKQIKSSALCGSCHAILLPIFNAKGEKVGEEFEQATYLEWLNSDFQNEIKPYGGEIKTCQDCHMPVHFKAPGFEREDLAYRISNIEDNTFPFVDNRAPDKDITQPVRTPYARHMLSSMNIFVLKMFQQFSTSLGIRLTDPMATFGLTGNNDPRVTGLDLAQQAGLKLAREETARVEILSATTTAKTVDVKVRVTNLAGHAFPSGVSFRRAFLDFALLDASGKTLWESGATNQYGVITDGPGGPTLPTEFLERDADGKQQYQPHYQTITKQSQVQIYEELAKNPEGEFTTSFVALFDKVKINRLQPRGYSTKGPFAKETNPDARTAKDPDYNNGSGADTIVYSIPLADIKGTAVTASATVFYQTIPPYYLRQRFTDSTMPDTYRLMDFVSKLNVENSAIDDWKLLVAGARRPLS